MASRVPRARPCPSGPALASPWTGRRDHADRLRDRRTRSLRGPGPAEDCPGPGPAVPALLLAWIGHLDLVSAALAAATLVIASVLAGLVGADTAAAVRRRLASLERLGDRFDALVEGLPLLRAFGRAAEHERAVAASGEQVRTATLATLRIALLAGLVLELLAAVGTALVAVRLGLRLDAGQRILPQALAVLILVPEVFLPVRRLTADFHAGTTGRAVLARLGGLTVTERVSRPAAAPAPGVLLEGVGLAAEGRSLPVLDGIDLRVSPGERVCLVGPSGAGKTSLLRVVAGLVPPTAGRVRLEGPLPALGWVPQHPTVLSATVLENITLGRPGVDERIARQVLEVVGLGSWVRSLPLGLRTPLSGLDAALSLGERRRLAVARSLAGPARDCGCWTSRPPAWTRPASGGWWRNSAGSSTGRPRSSPRTTRRPPLSGSGRSNCVTAASATPEWSAPPRIAVGVPDGRPVTGSPRSAAGSPRLGLDRRDRRRVLVAAGVGLAGELAALGLLTTGAWLLLSASLRPPILLLSIAIGAVQLFSFLRGTARYVERLASHSLGLSLQADLRAWLYRCLAQLVPCGLPGGDRGDLLTRLIRDTEEAQDLVVRAAVPVLAAAAAWAAAVVTAVALLPPAGWAILAAGILAAAGIAVAVILADRTAAELPAARGAVASWVLGTLTAREELAALGAGEWALDQLAERERVLGARTRAAAATAGLGRAACALAGGAGLAGVAWAGTAALRAGRIGPVELGVLVFLALGVAAVFQGLPDAVGRLPVSLASLTRLASLGSLPRPGPGLPTDEHAPRPRTAHGRTRPPAPSSARSASDRHRRPARDGSGLPEPSGPRAPRPEPGARPRPAGRAGRTERFGQDAGRPHLAALPRPHRRQSER